MREFRLEKKYLKSYGVAGAGVAVGTWMVWWNIYVSIATI